MNKAIIKTVLSVTGAQSIRHSTLIQPLWSGYGELMRLQLIGGKYPSIILKHVKPPGVEPHPRGWDSRRSHARKLRSYQVEACWYQVYAESCNSHCSVPRCLAVDVRSDQTTLILTDLDAAGFSLRKKSVVIEDVHACLSWLASFHARFINSRSDGLWERGSYWHLDTRPDELAALEDEPLRQAAPLIDRLLRTCRFQTLIHGDAKLANFCFGSNTSAKGAAAVDFQYVGRGCGMSDVAYFLGSCLSEGECENLENSLLDYYFCVLRQEIAIRHPAIDGQRLEDEWRSLFDVAWTDFHRFLKGWSPGHWKINSYSEVLASRVVQRLRS